MTRIHVFMTRIHESGHDRAKQSSLINVNLMANNVIWFAGCIWCTKYTSRVGYVGWIYVGRALGHRLFSQTGRFLLVLFFFIAMIEPFFNDM